MKMPFALTHRPTPSPLASKPRFQVLRLVNVILQEHAPPKGPDLLRALTRRVVPTPKRTKDGREKMSAKRRKAAEEAARITRQVDLPETDRVAVEYSYIPAVRKAVVLRQSRRNQQGSKRTTSERDDGDDGGEDDDDDDEYGTGGGGGGDARAAKRRKGASAKVVTDTGGGWEEEGGDPWGDGGIDLIVVDGDDFSGDLGGGKGRNKSTAATATSTGATVGAFNEPAAILTTAPWEQRSLLDVSLAVVVRSRV